MLMIPMQTPLFPLHSRNLPLQIRLFPLHLCNQTLPNRLKSAISAVSLHCGNYNLASEGDGDRAVRDVWSLGKRIVPAKPSTLFCPVQAGKLAVSRDVGRWRPKRDAP